MTLEDVDEGILGLAEKIGHAVRDRDEEPDDHEQAGRHRHVVGPDHGERRDGPGVVGLFGQVRGALPPDEAVQGKQRGQHEAVPEGPARRPLGRHQDREARVVMEKEDGAEEQQGRRADRSGDLEENAGVVDGAHGANADDVDERGDGHRDAGEQHDVGT
jgi:hypothetical protein